MRLKTSHELEAWALLAASRSMHRAAARAAARTAARLRRPPRRRDAPPRRSLSHDHGHANVGPPDATVTFHVKRTGEVVEASAYRGENLLRLAQRHDVPLEGACEGVTACSTCHVILEDAFFERLEDDGDEAGEAEEDMLDQAFGLEPTSRLACQLVVDDRFDGIHITLPEATRNFYVDGHVPQPH